MGFSWRKWLLMSYPILIPQPTITVSLALHSNWYLAWGEQTFSIKRSPAHSLGLKATLLSCEWSLLLYNPETQMWKNGCRCVPQMCPYLKAKSGFHESYTITIIFSMCVGRNRVHIYVLVLVCCVCVYLCSGQRRMSFRCSALAFSALLS